MRCIICLQERVPSDEHVFPYAIGGSLITDRVCKVCNSTLGSKVDARLTGHALVAMRRDRLRLESEKGNVPFALAEVVDDARLDSVPEQKMKLTEGRDGKLRAEMVYNRLEHDDGVTIVVDASARKSIPTIIQRERKRAGLEALSSGELEAISSKIAADVRELERPVIRGRVALDLVEFKRPLLKIAYEMTHWWLGDAYLDDPEAALFREALTTEGDCSALPIRGSFVVGIMEPFDLWVSETDGHLAFCFSQGGNIHLGIKIFDVFTGVAVVSQDASRYGIAENDGWLVSLDAVGRTHKFSPFLEACLAALAARKRAGFRR